MSLAMFRVMALALWRDRAALVMAFLLPPVVFLIFSAVFAGTTGDDVKPKLAIADLTGSADGRRLEAALLKSAALRAVAAQPDTLAEVRARVRSGQADAGLVIQGDLTGVPAPILIIADPGRAIAGPLVEARTREALGAALPDVMLRRTLRDVAPATGALTASQNSNVDMAVSSVADDPASAPRPPALFVHQDIAAARSGAADITYYAGAVTILFGLLAAMHGALSLIDERQSGIVDRILAGRHGMTPVVSGKFLFLALQAAAQAAVIYAVAEAVYGVPVLAHLGLWLVTTAAASICAAGLALGMVAVCRTRDQAQMLSTFVILVLAAVGGSMVPRFLMPPWLQDVGWLTPHAWVIDGYQGVLWRDEGPSVLYRPWLVMALFGGVGFALAQLASRHARR